MPAVLSVFPSNSPELEPRDVTPVPMKTLPLETHAETSAYIPSFAALPPVPGIPAETAQKFPASWPAPLSVLPTHSTRVVPIRPMPQEKAPYETSHVKMAIPAFTVPPVTSPVHGIEADFTDDDLREAFGPIVEQAVRSAVFSQENGMDTYLEPMLRATIRRALAEYSPASRPFRAPRAMDRFLWHLQALFTSRTYEDILFDKTHRFQVEEVFLLDAASLALVSFASCDPARHSSVKKVVSTVQRLAVNLRDDDGKIRDTIELPDKRSAISKTGRLVTLMAVVRGRPSELVLADLEFALRRIEDRFREQFQQEGSPLLYTLQPFLEDCLLIQAPASAA
jgi:hypothetical protein